MTNKQQLFIQHYLCSLNATEAAKLAGYSAKTAYSIGAELLKNPEIQKAIEQQTHERINSLIANRSERMIFLTGIMRDIEQNTKERLRACELLCRLDGDFINKSSVEVKTENTLSELVLKEYKSNEDKN